METLDQYQQEAARTLTSTFGAQSERHLACDALGIAGEAGEVADYLKKVLFHGHQLDRERLVKELGDVLWYLAAIASEIGVPLSEVAAANIDKLAKRYPDGFSREASRARLDVEVGHG